MVLGLIIANLIVILIFIIGVIIYKHYIIRPDKLIKELKDRGKSIEDILEIAKSKRLNEREVKLYYLLYFFQDFQNSGFGLVKIRESALNAGWPRELVDIVYNKLRNM